MNTYLQIFLAGTIATFPSLLVKRYIKSEKTILLFLAVLCYSILLYMYICIYKKEDISKAYPMILTLQILFISFIALIYYKEKFTKEKIIGLIGCITGIYFLTKTK